MSHDSSIAGESASAADTEGTGGNLTYINLITSIFKATPLVKMKMKMNVPIAKSSLEKLTFDQPL